MATIYESPYPPFAIPTDQSVAQWLLKYNPENTAPDKPIFEDFGAPFKSVTYGGIRTAAAQGAAGLKDVFGLREGDVVAVLGTNSVDWAVLAQSIMWAGATICAINPVATAYELVHYFEVAGARFIFAEADVLPKVEESLKMSGKTTTVAILGEGSNARYQNFPRDVINDTRAPLPPFDLSQKDNRNVMGAIVFSSGTSGKPKGVMLTHHNLISSVFALRSTDPHMSSGFQREVFYAPLSHIYGLFTVNLACFTGQLSVLMPKYQFHDYIKKCAEIKATILRLVPATAVSMAKDPFTKTLDLTSVGIVMCAGAPLSQDVVKQLQVILKGSDITQGYGLSEATVSMLRPHLSVEATGSVGQLMAGTRARVVDDDYNDVPRGESGEFLVQSPSVFVGYKDNVKETEGSFKDGWFCTGDVIRVDSKGFLWLTDRKKELIKYKGNQVAPAELEDILLSHPIVREAAVCGTYDEVQQTEIPIAYVNLQPLPQGTTVAAQLEQIRAFVDEKVSPHKKLRGGVHFLEVMPRNINGKLVRRQLPAKIEDDRKSKLKSSKL